MRTRGNVGLVALALVVTAARTLRPPDSYATASWLLTYAHGPLKRGLIGTLVAPLLTWKTADEGTFVLQSCSLLVLVALGAALVRSARPMLSVEAAAPVHAALLVAVVAVVTSPWVVFAAHTNGFLDHWLALVTLAAITIAPTRARWLVPLLAAAGVAIHEMFLVFGLPAVALAVAMAARPSGPRRLVRDLSLLLGAVALTAGVLGWGLAAIPDAQVAALRDDIVGTGVVGGAAADNAVFHLTHTLAENAGMQKASLWQRVTRLDLAWLAAPPVALLVAWTVLPLWQSARRWILALPLLFAPLLLHAVAWDTARFTLLVIFQVFAGWLVVFRHTPPPNPGRAAWPLLVGGLLVIGNNVTRPVPLMDAEHDGEGPLYPRSAPTLRSFGSCTPVFPNADFELGTLDHWLPEGAAFEAPLRSALGPGGGRSPTGGLGRWWLGTYGLSPVDGRPPADTLTGTLTSEPFPVRGDALLFLLGGGHDAQKLRVSLRVDGEEVADATGEDIDTMRPHAWRTASYRGRTATIVITDQSTRGWGHVNVDHFCWFKRAAGGRGGAAP